MTVFLDFETRSEADLKKVGAWTYSEHPSTEIICASWAIDDGPVHEWTNWFLGEPSNERELEISFPLQAAIEAGHTVEAHNVAFEYSIWKNVCVARYGWPEIALERWRDTMALASYYALPPALDNLARVLGLPGKDPEGSRLISKYSKLHLKTAKRVIPSEDLEKFVKYCRKDVEIERAAANILGELPEDEEAIFLHDLAVNARGMYLDQPGILKASAVVEERSLELEEEFRELTGLGPGQRDKIIAWSAVGGVLLDNLQADYIDDLLEAPPMEGSPVGDLESGPVRRALEIRRAHNKASIKKLSAMLRHRGRDGKARFQTRYHGAVTGRNTGAGFQPLNLKRGYKKEPPEQLVRNIEAGNAAWLDCLYGDAMEAVANASRHWITASKGCRIIAGDYVSVEAVLLACVAGEEWKVKAFRNQELIYERMGDKIHGLPPGTVTAETHPVERRDGKTGELAFGYQGALGAWLKFDNSGRHSDERIIQICRAWRNEHPAIVGLWRGLEDAAVEAVQYPGRVTGYREIGFERVDAWLTMILPDGKRLWYWAPQVRLTMPQWHKPDEREDCATGDCNCTPRPQVVYMAQKEGRWRRQYTYGGKLTENAIQAISRQILKPAEMRVGAQYGYPVVLSVYDEIVCDVPIGHGSAEEFKEIMEHPLPAFAEDWPIRAEVWEGHHYKK